MCSSDLKQIKVYDFFEYVAGSNTFDFCKPDPRHLTNVIEIMQGDLKKSIMIGDSETDANAAKAAGEYDGYVAEPRAYEWDIAAGHAILEHAGGTVTDFEGNEILYGKQDLKNPSIILKNKNIL